MDRCAGKVKWFNPSKGFGFITLENGEDVFVFHQDVKGDSPTLLWAGSSVTLSVEYPTDKGECPKARNVVVTEVAESAALA